MADMSFERGAVRPFACLQEGWRIVQPYYGTYLGICLVGPLIGGLAPLQILWGPMACGIYLTFLRQIDRRREPEFGTLFKGFDYFANSLIATLVALMPFVVIVVPAYVAMIGVVFSTIPQQQKFPGPQAPPSPTPMLTAMGVFYFLLFVTSILTNLFFFFVYPLIVDRKLTGMEAVRTSVKAASANFGGLLGLMFLIFLYEMLGFMLCCIGLIFVAPICFASVAVAYRQVFPATAAPERRRLDLDDWDPSPRESTDIKPSSDRDFS